MRSTWMAIAITTVLAPAGLAQEARTSAPAAESAAESATANEAQRPSIRVLQHPYEISSFYRSGESPLGPWAGLPSDPAYGIADFYRSSQGRTGASPYGWSAFWTHGYRAPRLAPLAGYRRTIGENGDLFLMVPFLAPVGPLSGAFFGY